ncbi:hypothetical protein SNE40_007607 [Patella caerulea]|uniref:Uncharacterized protein n=1 Tax=Patella caerulea TaxID=87958 RepID=A0AAN8Q8H3_PATCE
MFEKLIDFTHNNKSKYEVPDLACYPTISLKEFTHFSVGPALLIVLFLSVFERRKNSRGSKWYSGRPGLLVPVNLLDGDEDRMAFAAAFGSTATNCLTLIQGHFIPPDCPMWFKIFYAMLAVIEMGVDYYPFFACLSKKHSVIDSLIGLAYSVLWFLVNLAHVFECSGDTTRWVFRGQPIVIQLPVLICLMYLISVFFSRILTTGLKFLVKIFTGREASGLTKFQVLHVKELLKGKNSSLPSLEQLERLNGSIWSLIRYRHDPTYRFSTRVTSTFTVALLCLYEFALMSFLTVDKTLDTIQNTFDTVDKSTLIQTFGAEILNQLDLLINTMRGESSTSRLIIFKLGLQQLVLTIKIKRLNIALGIKLIYCQNDKDKTIYAYFFSWLFRGQVQVTLNSREFTL